MKICYNCAFYNDGWCERRNISISTSGSCSKWRGFVVGTTQTKKKDPRNCEHCKYWDSTVCRNSEGSFFEEETTPTSVCMSFKKGQYIKTKQEGTAGRESAETEKRKDSQLYREAKQVLKQLYGENAKFRSGQYEAIEATLNNRRTLVVQRTGWGKSLVYFVSTKLNKMKDKGLTIVISPLLILMDNQLESASKLGLECEILNSNTKENWDDILTRAKENEVDLLLVTPESLFNEEIQTALPEIRIGLFVVDEAHCISDWGHDFRLQYGNLYKIINALPPNVPLLGTTATANDRVVADLKRQWGENVYVSRGPLTRESLYIQILNHERRVQRYAWILQNLDSLQGSGIIYCLTQRDCEYLADFLKRNGKNVEAYHAGMEREKLQEIEYSFKENKLKAIVATIKLGMGYDKGDIAFVIHFQKPSNIVSYYQQIGRAGRDIDKALVFLMSGKEDDDIINYFIDTAFPTEEECRDVLRIVEKYNGINQYGLIAEINRKKNRIEKAVYFLENIGCIYKQNYKYYISAKQFVYDRDHYAKVTEIRRREHEQMTELVKQEGCISKFIVNCLDDYTAVDCGHCTNCTGKTLIPEAVSWEYMETANEYVNGMLLEIEPRKRWATSNVTVNRNLEYVNERGICLSIYGDPGYGQLVKDGKYGKEGRFSSELVGRSVEVLKPIIKEKGIKHLTYVPSLRSNLVKVFAEELAKSLRVEFVDLLDKHPAAPQKNMENSAHQCENAFVSFSTKDNVEMPERILLVDDMIDSKWTMTVCGFRLMEAGCSMVFPFALADTSGRGDK